MMSKRKSYLFRPTRPPKNGISAGISSFCYISEDVKSFSTCIIGVRCRLGPSKSATRLAMAGADRSFPGPSRT